MRKLTFALIQFAVFMGTVELYAQTLCLSDADASAAADKLYIKGNNLADTIAKTRPNFAKWAKEQNAQLAKEVTFSPWVVSNAIDKWRGNVIKEIDPSVHPVNMEAVFGARKVWNKANVEDGSIFNLQKYNALFSSRTITFMTRKIDAKNDIKLAMTFSHCQNASVFLNGKPIYEDKKGGWNIRELTTLELNLKKGENTLTILGDFVGDKQVKPIFYAPYATPAKFLAKKAEADFPAHTSALFNYGQGGQRQVLPALFAAKDNRGVISNPADAHFWPTDFVAYPLNNLIEQSKFSAGAIEKRFKALANSSDEAANIERIKIFQDAVDALKIEKTLGYDIKNVRAAMEDILKEYPDYDKSLFKQLESFEGKMSQIKAGILKDDKPAIEDAKAFNEFASKALLANPLLKKFPEWVYIKRNNSTRALGLPQNWQGNTSLTNGIKNSFKDELWKLDIFNPEKSELIFKPQVDSAVMDLDVSYDGSKILYSTIDEKNRWQLDEFDTKTKSAKQVTPRIHDSVDAYDGVYLPDGKILFCSTACHVGVPCVGGSDYVANLYTLDPNAGTPADVDNTMRQLTFEQDADWMPVVMDNGRILYTRWEYTDNSHYFSRILMHMNPDGTSQSSFYGSTSYWPNSLFYCRQIPNDPNKFVGIVTGHHGVARSGELHMFDVSKGRIEEGGRVHKFPSYGREYKAEMIDELVNGKWPQVLYPYPLSEKVLVASVRQDGSGKWGIYLVDKYDNMTLLKETDGNALFEPMPLTARTKPAEIMDKTDPDLDYGYVFLNDIYQGGGLKDVPRGTVKALRVLEYYYCYRNTGGHDLIGNEASWDVKRIHGTVPVEEDGSALFKVPANRPIAIQPLDKDGKALALMRSWFTVMPNETQSCVGCHEGQGMTPTSKPALASRKRPQEIQKFIGDVRGYSFVRDVQPVLDKYCVGCHDGKKEGRPNLARSEGVWRKFPQSYLELNRYIRRAGPESNQHMLSPLEFHADTSELIQMLKKGHKGVKLDDESMAILLTWIDLNVPCFGTWKEVYPKIPSDGDKERMKFLAKYANRHDDPEKITYDGGIQEFVSPAPAKKHTLATPKSEKFPFDSAKAKAMQAQTNLPQQLLIDMGNGTSMRLKLIPAGEYVMGSNNGFYDEGPAVLTKIEKPFYIGQFEVTNKQFSAFDKNHNSGHFDRHWKDHINKGYPANQDDQSVVRITWNQANDFCKWLSKKIGVDVSLPTEKQWEWAARAGTDSVFWFGNKNANYGEFENFSDAQSSKFAVNGVDPQPRINPEKNLAFVPADTEVDDGFLVSAPIGSYKANPFDLYDMLGNISEWTSNDYTETLGGKKVDDKKTVRGGSWRDRAKWSRVTIRRDYYPWQRVYNVGMRIVINDAAEAAKLLQKADPLPEKKIERNTKPLIDNVGVPKK